jgi:hypothetical protein
MTIGVDAGKCQTLARPIDPSGQILLEGRKAVAMGHLDDDHCEVANPHANSMLTRVHRVGAAMAGGRVGQREIIHQQIESSIVHEARPDTP